MFTDNGPKKGEKISGDLGEKAFLMSEIRGEWPQCFELKGSTGSPKLGNRRFTQSCLDLDGRVRNLADTTQNQVCILSCIQTITDEQTSDSKQTSKIPLDSA